MVPNGIGDDYFTTSNFINIQKKYSLDDYILCVSRFEPRKNQTLLLRAFDELGLREQGFKLVFIGRTDIKVSEFEDYLAAHPDLQSCVVRLKDIPFNELLSFYAQAKVAVYPSLAEGFGIPPLESAAMGTVILCSNATAMSDFGFFDEHLFDPHDLETFKGKLMKSITHPNRSLMKDISSTIRTEYHWSNIAAKFTHEVKKIF